MLTVSSLAEEESDKKSTLLKTKDSKNMLQNCMKTLQSYSIKKKKQSEIFTKENMKFNLIKSQNSFFLKTSTKTSMTL